MRLGIRILGNPQAAAHGFDGLMAIDDRKDKSHGLAFRRHGESEQFEEALGTTIGAISAPSL